MSCEKFRIVVAAGCAGLLAVWTGCTKKEPAGPVAAPHDVLARYISEAITMKSPDDVSRLEDIATGELSQQLKELKADEKLFDETFRKQKIESASALKIRDERRIDDSHYSITYELTYRDTTQKEEVEKAPPVAKTGAVSPSGETVTKDASTDLVTTKKHAILLKDPDSGQWLISEVHNLKTFIEHTAEENISASPSGAK